MMKCLSTDRTPPPFFTPFIFSSYIHTYIHTSHTESRIKREKEDKEGLLEDKKKLRKELEEVKHLALQVVR